MCGIMLLEGDRLVPIASSAGLDPDKTPSFKIGEGIVGKSFQQGETIWGDNVNNCPEAKSTRQAFRSFISVPIGQLGILGLFSEEVGEFDKQDVELAEVLAGHLKEEIKRVRLEEDLRRQSIRDPLTDLYNRRHFNETLRKEVERSERYGHNLAFLMIDVDRFKEINDRYSHQIGDEVLKEVADLLTENVREADTVIRYGGDEFLVVMPETNGDSIHLVDRLKDKLDEWNERSDLLESHLTLATGVSHWHPDQERDVEDALKQADRKMYEDKGR
jgi:diguanylate cyclase (GGDEF)-like protein